MREARFTKRAGWNGPCWTCAHARGAGGARGEQVRKNCAEGASMRVAVIGGGVAGLSAAPELVGGGADPVVFEAEERAGGKVGTRAERGWVTEDGPNFLARPLDALLDASGWRGGGVKPPPPPTRWVPPQGRGLRAPSLGLLARAGAFRALLEPLFAR